MYFKSMFLQGFKSFADKTFLEFNGGITVVVGPNGSGKSNISDAIRWVMGETSAKSLRGANMQDVIFCGSEKRKPLGFAEVTITMDNSDRSMNIDFEEVSITRRVYRSGESEYLINKAPCRLKDIHELFMDTGLGRDGYSIIGQGKIDAILSAKSDERRHIFDEAAGITKYRYRKNEAEKKLSMTEENLTRISDIVKELEGRVEPLRKQSEKAVKFLKLRESQKEIEVSLWLHIIDENKQFLDKLISDCDNVKSQIESLYKDIDKSESEINIIKDKIRLNDNETDKTKSEMYAKRDEITQAGGEIDVLQANINYNTQNIYRIEGETESLSKRITEHETVKQAQNLLLDKLMNELDKANAEISEKAAELDLIKSKLEQKIGNANSTAEQLNSLTDKISDIKIKAAANSQYIKSADEQILRAENELNALNEKYAAEKQAIDNANQKIEVLSQDSLTKKEQSENAAKMLEEQQKQLSSLLQKQLSLESDNKTNINRKTILEDLENDFDGYSKPVKFVMNEHKFGSLKKNLIYGPVSALIKADSKYITAVETSLGGAVNNIVTETEDDAKAAINYLKSSKKGRVTFLPVSSVKAKSFVSVGESKCKGYIGIASELVKCDSKFREVIEYLLGRTIVVDNMDNAVEMAKKYKYSFKIATLGGEILNVGGSIAGGSSNTSAASGLSRREDIKKLDVLIEQTEQEIKTVSAKVSSLRNSTEKLKKDDLRLRTEYYSAERTLAEYKTSAVHIINSYSEANRITSEAEARLNKLKSDKAQAHTLEAEFENALETLNSEYSSLFSQKGKADEDTKLLQTQSSELSSLLTELNISKNSLEKDIFVVREKLENSTNEIASCSAQIAEKNTEHDSLEKETAEAHKKIEALNELLSNSHTIINDFKLKLEELDKIKAENETILEKKEASLKEINSTIFNLQSEESRLTAKKTKYESERENVISKLWEEYELTYSAACEFKKPIENPTEAKSTLQGIKQQIKALGNINLNAIDEYKEVKERYEFLSAQQDDILKAKRELTELISEMTEIMTEMFDKNFKKLNEKFSETFKALFGGGHAKLLLADPSNILESGVEIEVQPPGKNLQSITLLSGGEKAFTAIALIFAILKTNPTKFCIFDEIEAALDDANVYRYADFLKAFSSKTQFIVISHRKGTMEAADTLYGVTMQEKGVTRLLSLDLSEIKE